MRPRRWTSGATLVEFSLVSLVLFTVVLAAIELDRMALIYSAVTNAARAGVRYAVVHGSDRTQAGANGPSSAASHAYLDQVVRNFAAAGIANTALLSSVSAPCGAAGICVDYVDGSNSPGARVKVVVVYPYDPFFSILPLRVNLSGVAEGVISF